MNTVVLKTERLILRQFETGDLDDFYEYAKNPEVGIHAGWCPHQTLSDTAEILFEFIHSNSVWAIVWRETGKVIGSIGLHKDGTRSPSRDIRALGYALSADYWGRGIMTEAVNRMLRYVFETLELKMLTVYHYAGNNRSRRVIEKCGFCYEGTLRRCSLRFDGKWMDDCCYSMTREEYLAGKPE